jgi:hypothetical protein
MDRNGEEQEPGMMEYNSLVYVLSMFPFQNSSSNIEFPMVMHASCTNGKQTDLGQIASRTACVEWPTMQHDSFSKKHS